MKRLATKRPATWRLVLWGSVAAVIFTGGILALGNLVTGAARLRPAALDRFGGPFQLVDQDGGSVTEQAFRNHPVAIFFGYTHCPDVCPTALSDMSRWQAELGEQARQIRFVFVTVDPDRDTPDVLRQYLESFPGRFLALSGPAEHVRTMLGEYNVVGERAPEADGSYTMDHSASIFLVNADGGLAGTVGPQDDEAAGLAKLRRLLTHGMA